MTGKVALKAVLSTTQTMLPMFFAELTDDDLQKPPVPGANNIAWQMGHLIASEGSLGAQLGASYPELPEPLKALSTGTSSKTNPDGGRLSKDDYLSWFNRVRKATIAAVDNLSEADFDKPTTGPMKDFAPTVGDLVVLIGNHTMMHVGQFSVVRRSLGKPVLF